MKPPARVTIVASFLLLAANAFSLTATPSGMAKIMASSSTGITLTAPNGGETYEGDEAVTISWVADASLSNFSVYYSLSNGTRWVLLGSTSSKSFTWYTPFLKKTCGTVLIKIAAGGITNPPFDVSDAPFIINKVAAVDPYEPNDSIGTAFSIAIDSLYSGAMVFNVRDSFVDSFSSYTDADYYKFTLPVPQLLKIRVVPEYSVTEYNRFGYTPSITLYDASGNPLVNSSNGIVNYNTTAGGTYYCRVVSWDVWCKYGIVVEASSVSTGIEVISPNGGETYEGDDSVTISWQADASVSNFSVYYSLSNGTRWVPLGSTSSKSLTWYTPCLKKTCGTVLIKVAVGGITNPPSDVSDAPFTINKTAEVDPYEPNDSIGTAFPIAIDSIYSGAMVFNVRDSFVDSFGSYTDADYFKFDLPGPQLLKIRVVPQYSVTEYNRSNYTPSITLYDASGNPVMNSGNGTVNYNTAAGGTYYCRVVSWEVWCKYGIVVNASSVSTEIEVVSPNGGETYEGDDSVTVSWQADASISSFSVYYSLSNGTGWVLLGSTSSESFTWYTPYLKKTCGTVLIKVAVGGITNPPFDVSDAPFTINKVASIDPYEPNDSISTAFPVAIDSIYSGAMVFNVRDSLVDSLKTYNDVDYYKFDLPGPRLMTIRVLPEYSGSAYNRHGSTPSITLYDASGNLLARSGNGPINYNATVAGTFYCKVDCWDQWAKYGINFKTLTILNAQTATFQSTTVQQATDSTYKVQVVVDTTDLVIDLTLNSKTGGAISTATLSTDELTAAPGTNEKIKAISLVADSEVTYSLKNADIAIRYNDVDLGDVQEKSIVVLWLNDSAGQWSPIDFSIDTADNIITAHTTHFSVFGVFTLPTTDAATSGKTVPSFGMNATFRYGKMGVAVTYNPLKVPDGMVRLYAVNGKLVKEGVVPMSKSGRSMVVFDCRNLGNGIYMLTFTGGSLHACTAVTLIK